MPNYTGHKSLISRLHDAHVVNAMSLAILQGLLQNWGHHESEIDVWFSGSISRLKRVSLKIGFPKVQRLS